LIDTHSSRYVFSYPSKTDTRAKKPLKPRAGETKCELLDRIVHEAQVLAKMPTDPQNQAQVIDQYVDLVMHRYRAEVRNEIRNELRAELDHQRQQQQAGANNINGPNFDELLDEIHRNSLRSNNFTVKPPSMFMGQSCEVFGDWIKQLERFMTMQGLKDSDELHRRACLESYLGGAARAMLNDALRVANRDFTYDESKDFLQQAFPDDRNRDIYQEKLMESRQKRLESVPEYASRLRELARLAYPDLQIAARDQIVRPFFLRGLAAEIKEQVRYREYGSLDEAVKTATYVEMQMNREEGEGHTPRIGSLQGARISAQPNWLAPLTTHHLQKEEKKAGGKEKAAEGTKSKKEKKVKKSRKSKKKKKGDKAEESEKKAEGEDNKAEGEAGKVEEGKKAEGEEKKAEGEEKKAEGEEKAAEGTKSKKEKKVKKSKKSKKKKKRG